MILFLVLCLGSVSRAGMTAEEYCTKKTSTYSEYQTCIENNKPKNTTQQVFDGLGNAFKDRADYIEQHQQKSTHCVPDYNGGLVCE